MPRSPRLSGFDGDLFDVAAGEDRRVGRLDPLLAGGTFTGVAPRPLLVHREVDGLEYGSGSASLVALGHDTARYDFATTPGPNATWHDIPLPGRPSSSAGRRRYGRSAAVREESQRRAARREEVARGVAPNGRRRK